MEEKVGSYVIDDKGVHKPNPDDEAMAERRKKGKAGKKEVRDVPEK